MEMIVEFFGGPMDGVTMTSDSPDPLDRHKVELMARVIGGCLRERAMKEGWSEAKIAALMPKYEYEFSKVREEGGIAHISLHFKGTS